MKLTTKVHGALDYITGAVLIMSPALLDLPAGPASAVPRMLGVAAILYSLLTRYEWGLLKLIPMRGHLALDFMSGVLLAASPWLFGFADQIRAPHVLLGLFEIGAALMTRTTYAPLPPASPAATA